MTRRLIVALGVVVVVLGAAGIASVFVFSGEVTPPKVDEPSPPASRQPAEDEERLPICGSDDDPAFSEGQQGPLRRPSPPPLPAVPETIPPVTCIPPVDLLA